MNEKQQQLTFDKGITNVPSDALCSDNALQESIGMIFDNGEHRVIQNPKLEITFSSPSGATDRKVVYIHKHNGIDRYIIIYKIAQNQWHLYWSENGNTINPIQTASQQTVSFPDSEATVTSIGKTLIAYPDKEPHYFLWKENGYLALGDLPAPEFKFWLIEYGANLSAPMKITNSGKCNDMIYVDSSNMRHLEDDKQEEWNDLIVGLYSKNKRSIAQKKCFCEPFFVRGAIELYDGTYTHITQPILMLPYFDRNTECTDYNWNLQMMTFYAKLYFNQSQSYLDWADIVKDVVIFITDSVCPYDLSVDQGIINGPWTVHGLSAQRNDTDKKMTINNTTIADTNSYYLALKLKDYNDFVKDIKSASVFYKLCEIGISSVSDKEISQYIEAHTLENLTTQEYLEYDDYFSRSKLFPGFVYAYNSRLNYANVSRSMFDGFGYFLPWDNNTPSTYTFYVKIRTDVNEIWVSHEEETRQIQGLYFFYPDSRAIHVTIYKDGVGCICDQELEEHPSLNGAYYLGGMPIDPTTRTAPTQYTESSITVGSNGFHVGTDHTSNNYKELLPNYIITSEVNNPWTFKAEGYNKVGTGEIIGMSTTTMALSQDQFGRTDLIVFSKLGVWGMQVDGTGLYQSIHPFTRDVCNNKKSITQVDGAVFFSADKGLMMVSDKGVVCVSEQLSGRETTFDGVIDMGNFKNYLADCFMAYDYRDSLLWIFNNNRTHVVENQTVPYNTDYCYVYSIKSGTIGKYRFANAIENIVNNYPDTLLQTGATLYSLLNRQNINLDSATNYAGLMITRPIKLENSLALKSLMQIRHIYQMNGTFTLRIFASNNLNNWTELHSLRGTPWKYYRFRFDFANMKATDRFAGTMLITQERRTNKLR